MRDSWEGGTDLDEPANITERELRSLRRGARAGKMAILLALVTAGLAGWSLIMGPDALLGFEGIQDVKQKVLSVVGQPAQEETRAVRAPAPTSSQAPGDTRAGTAPATPSNRSARDSSATQLSVSNNR